MLYILFLEKWIVSLPRKSRQRRKCGWQMKIHKQLFSFVFIIACIGVSVPVYTAVDRDTIIGIWLFDEDINNNVVKDASGNGHDGEVKRSPKIVDGQFGKALSFSGNDQIVVPHHDRFSTPTFTLMAWINIEDILSGWRMIVGKDDWPDRNYAMFVHREGERLHCSFCAGRCMGNFNSHATIADGDWHHVAFTYDGTVERMYIDAELDDDKRMAEIPGTNTAPVIIGRPPFRGLIDEVFIGNAAISANDVRRTFEDGIQDFILTAVEPASKLATTWASLKHCCD